MPPTFEIQFANERSEKKDSSRGTISGDPRKTYPTSPGFAA